MTILINFFRKKKTSTTAYIAKKRLQTIIVDERKIKNEFEIHCLTQLKNDLLQVIRKYINEPKIISIHLKKDENTSILTFDIFFSNKKI